MFRKTMPIVVGLGLLWSVGCAATPGAGDASSKVGGDAGDVVGAVDAGRDAGVGCRTCASAQAECGVLDDGCGSTITCGTCGAGLTCGSQGVANRCGPSVCGVPCVPRTCLQVGNECGLSSDGCGGLMRCGDCRVDQECSLDTFPRRCEASGVDAGCGQACGPGRWGILQDACGQLHDCGSNRDAGCQPASCVGAQRACGTVIDECGLALDCGGCWPGAACVERDGGAAACEPVDGGDAGC